MSMSGWVWRSQRPFKKPQYFRARKSAKAAGFFDWIDAPEMTRARHYDRARKKTRLLQRGQELFRLCCRVDDVVFAAINQKKARAVVVDRGVTHGRGLKVSSAADHRRAAKELFGDRIARPGDLVVFPLRQHVIDPVKPDHQFDVERGRSIAVVAVSARE